VDNTSEQTRPLASPPVTRFGPYEVDRVNSDVRKFGIRLKLAGQPLEVLLLLLERPGQVVTREELQQRLWPEDVFVDFERSLNSAVKKLRAALNDNPENPRYIETQPRKGYRFIASIENVAIEAQPETPLSEQTLTSVEQAKDDVPAIAQRRPYLRLGFAAAAIALLAIGPFFAFRQRAEHGANAGTSPKGPNIRSSIAILGFKNLSSQHEGDWLGGAIAQMLATELQAGGKLKIVPEEAVARAKGDLELKEKDGYPRDTLRELNQKLSSDYVVAGSYVALGDKDSGQVRLDLRLQEAISGETLASIAVSGKQSEIFDLVGRAGHEMQSKGAGTIGGEGDADWRAAIPENSQAAKLYREGLARLREGNNVAAADVLQQSVAIDPGFALGHAVLADAWQGSGYDARAEASAQKALTLIASLPENLRMRIEGQYYESQHDWAGSIPAYRHLFQDYPDDLEAGLKLANSEIAAGKMSEASSTISSMRSVKSSAGNDPRIDLAESLIASRTGDFRTQQELARSAAKKAESAGLPLLFARAKLQEGWALDDQSQVDQALEAYRAAQPIFEKAGDTDSTATVLDDIGIILQKKGDRKAAQETLEEAQKRFREVGDKNGLGASLTNLGELYHTEGELAAATELYREALEIFRKTSRKENEYAILNNLGGVLFESGEFREAKKDFELLLQARQISGEKSTLSYAKSNLAATLWIDGQLDESASLLKEALRNFRNIGDKAGIASALTGYSKVLILKRDLRGAREALQEALKINLDAGNKGDAAFVRVLLAQITMTSGHPEEIDAAALQSDIDEIASESHGGDEVESIAIQIPILLSKGKTEAAEQSLVQAQSVSNASWLSKYHLMVASAQIDAVRGKAVQSRRKIEAARAQAVKVGCRACELEPTFFASKGDARRLTAPAPEISLDTPLVVN
jgi:DNA-binding winged helix-turn-helix (wHTH) protein/tetratricopeptide (TPR) repeat protein/TolB-like protein